MLGLAVIACTACESGVPLEKRAPAVATLVQPWGKVDLARTNSFLVPREARLTVVVIAEGHRPQETLVIQQLKAVLPQYFGPQDLAEEALLREEALQRADQGSADFLLMISLEQWPGGFVDPSASRCPPGREAQCNLASSQTGLKINMQVHDRVNRRMVDLVSARGVLGIQTWFTEDLSPLINDILTRMMGSLAP